MMKLFITLLLAISLFSSCSNKETILEEVFEAIKTDKISSVKHLCTPRMYQVLQHRKKVFQYQLLHIDETVKRNYDENFYAAPNQEEIQANYIAYNSKASIDIKCGDGQHKAYCKIRQSSSIIDLPHYQLVKKDNQWLVDLRRGSAESRGELYLTYLQKGDFDKTIQLTAYDQREHINKMKKMIKSVDAESSDSTILFKDHITKGLQNQSIFDPTSQWLYCTKDNRRQYTKMCYLCDIWGESQPKTIFTVTQMGDKKWYVMDALVYE